MRKPHEGIPEDRMTLEQQFDHLMWIRAETWRNHLTPDRPYTFDAEDEGVVDDAELVADLAEAEVIWVRMVRAMFAAYGAQIMDRLPPDTILDPRTGAVTIDPTRDAWLRPWADDAAE
jgi:hypothetical protein